ncbi:MAG TPA: sigma-70 family RNA polymerase sigma factor, partial [Polyangiales bacterium]|nr:sigma-70 family RNA polymerase sigma factor [Polyangiales bacterium]
FFYGVVTHACLNRIRDRKNRRRLLELHTASVPRPASLAAAADQALQLRELLERVPEQLAFVAVCSYVDELTHDEISQLLGCSRRQVGALLERLTNWLKAQEAASCG